MNITEDDRIAIERLPNQQRETLYHKLRAVEAVEARQRGSKAGEVARQASELGVSQSSLNRWIHLVKQHGITGLIDGRVSS